MRIRNEDAGQRLALGYFAAAVLAVSALFGCTGPRMEGGQFKHPPTGFVFDANAREGRPVFPDREAIDVRAWMTMGEDHNSIFVTEYEGPATREQVQAARDAQEKNYGNYLDYGNLEEMTIDGRPAWGWLETQHYKGKLSSYEYKAVVSYDDVSYAIEFFAGREDWRDEHKLRAFVKTFEVGRSKPNYAALGVGAVLLLGAVAYFRMSAKG